MSADPGEEAVRIDKWLWRARFFKTRTLAAKVCSGGRVRHAGSSISKAHHRVRVGDVLTFAQGRYIRVIKVLALGSRRGPASEARLLYEDLKPPEDSQAMPDGPAGSPGSASRALPAGRRPAGSGRPTKKERRLTERLRGEGE